MAELSDDLSRMLVTPEPRLCTRCKDLDLKEWFYPTIGLNSNYYPGWRDCDIEWSKVVKTQGDCTFCAILVASLTLDPELSNSSIRDVKRLKLMAVSIGVVKYADEPNAEAQEDIPSESLGWRRVGTSYKRNIWSISVTAEHRMLNPLGQARLLPMCTNQSKGKDRLLHCTQHPQNEIDPGLIKSWLAACDTHHPAACSMSSWSTMGEAGLRMIDVKANCVVKITSPVEYFALSYCWGKPLQFRPSITLTRGNESDLSTPGCLSKIFPHLPLTIQHAIELTQMLGWRYLWVDSLCIVQDDDFDKSTQIIKMNTIYSHASLTIVAAAGLDASHGLPGVKCGSRSFRSLSSSLGQFRVISVYPGLRSFDAISASGWRTRAWTFQEEMCSKRRLLFTKHEVVWSCASETLSEVLAPESSYTYPGTTFEYGNFGYGPEFRASASPLQRFNAYMKAASVRKLGNEGDRLNCIAGLLNEFGAEFPSGFLWGLPVDVLDSALLFHSKPYRNAPFGLRWAFPSWSWLGHATDAVSTIGGPYDIGFSKTRDDFSDPPSKQTDARWVRKAAAFHVMDDTGYRWSILNSTQINGADSASYLESKARWIANDTQEVLVQTLIALGKLRIPLDHVLAFWTQSVWLDVDWRKSETGKHRGFGKGKKEPGHGYPIRDSEGREIGYLPLTKEFRKIRGDKLEFILIAESRRWETELGPILQVLYIERKGGIAFRLQIVRDSMITWQRWQAMDPEWKMIIMA